MVKIISLFNHKGGVSKTTTAFNLGWMLGRKGKRVLLVDCDPQCNLTGMVLQFENQGDVSSIVGPRSGKPKNIKDALAPAFESRPALIDTVDCVVVPGNSNLLLMPGHIGLSEYEVTLGIAQELSGSLVTLRNLPGSIHYLIEKTAREYKIDLVLIDMSPSLGAINQNLLTTSDFFLVPMHPDYFSIMAIESLSNVLPKWKKWSVTASNLSVLSEAEYPFPKARCGFLGYVMQKYRPRQNSVPSTAFQQWIEEVETAVDSVLLPTLGAAGMMLPDTYYIEAGFNPAKPILQMSDFNSLIGFSQRFQVPVYELTDEQLNQVGTVLESSKVSMRRFEGLFSTAADRVISMVSHAGHN